MGKLLRMAQWARQADTPAAYGLSLLLASSSSSQTYHHLGFVSHLGSFPVILYFQCDSSILSWYPTVGHQASWSNSGHHLTVNLNMNVHLSDSASWNYFRSHFLQNCMMLWSQRLTESQPTTLKMQQPLWVCFVVEIVRWLPLLCSFTLAWV